MKNLFSNKITNIAMRYGLIALIFLAQSMQSYAQVVTVDQPLYFGKFAMANQPSTTRVTIRNNGTFTTNANTFLFDSPTRGEYTLTGAPANSTYTVIVPPTVNLTGPLGVLLLDNINVRPNSLITDASGEDQFRLSGRLRGLAANGPFGDGIYDATFTITFIF